MTKRFLLSLLCIILAISCVSCANQKTKEEIISEVDKKIDTTTVDKTYDYQNEVGKWLTPEVEYKYDETIKSYEGISNCWGGNYFIKNDRLYFKVSKPTSTSSGTNSMLTYISLLTGEKHHICPDPLCEHTEESGCQYVDWVSYAFDPESMSSIYVIKSIYNGKTCDDAIYKIDLDNNRTSMLYTASPLSSNEYYNSISFVDIENNNLFFAETHVDREKNENGEVISTETVYLKKMDLSDKTVTVISDEYDSEHGEILKANGQLYFLDRNERRFYSTDMNYKNEKTILTFDEGYQIYNIYYDRNLSLLYVLISSNALHSSSKAEGGYGKIYCIGKNNRVEEVKMPSDQILDFQLTNEYIYYTIYDPIVFGTGPRGGEACDETGNKIYRVKRSNTAEAELIFDGRGEMKLGNHEFFIVGDYLYLNYYRLEKEGSLAWFRKMWSTARINFKDNTIKWINLD